MHLVFDQPEIRARFKAPGNAHLNGALLANAVRHLAGVNPYGQLGRQILQDVGDGDATFARRAV